MRIFFSVGEPSGDLHASNLIRHLKARNSNIECVGYGGPKMQEAGCRLHFDLTQLAVMFIWGALKKIGQFRQLASDAEKFFKSNKVDAVVLIDFSGFNWWIAKRAKKQGIPVFFYGVPQMWAWGGWRIKKIRKWVDHVLCKLPFEADWFEKRNCQATYVGHPFFDQLSAQTYDEEFVESCKQPHEKLLTLLPGSRNLEVENHLPMLLSAANVVKQRVENVRVAVACFNAKQFARAEELLAEHEVEADLYLERTPELMKGADACIACSGSVSLELLFHRKPTVIVYKPSWLYMLMRPYYLKVKFITLVNLIETDDIGATSRKIYDPDAPDAIPTVMPEYLTPVDRSADMAGHVIGWFKNPETAAEKSAKMDELATKYALPGATERAADYILDAISPLTYRRIDKSQIPAFSLEHLDQAAETVFVGPASDKKAA